MRFRLLLLSAAIACSPDALDDGEDTTTPASSGLDTDGADTDAGDTDAVEGPTETDAPADTDAADTDLAADTDAADTDPGGEPGGMQLAAIAGSYIGTASPTDACGSHLDYSLVSVSPIDASNLILSLPTAQAVCTTSGADPASVSFGCQAMIWTADRQLGGGNFCLAEFRVQAGGAGDGSTLNATFQVTMGGGCVPCSGVVTFTGTRAPF